MQYLLLVRHYKDVQRRSKNFQRVIVQTLEASAGLRFATFVINVFFSLSPTTPQQATQFFPVF